MKPKFDPSKPFEPIAAPASGAKPKFDPNQPFTAAGTPKEQGPSGLVSGVRQFVQGASANLSDELAGGLEGAGRAVGLEGVGGPMKDISVSSAGPTLDWSTLVEAYEKGRDKERGDLRIDEKVNPGISMVANLAGTVASPINKLAPGASLAKQGAIVGGVTGFGSSESQDAPGIFIDSATGSILGAGLGKGAEKASPYIDKVVQGTANKFKDLSELFAGKALGAERGTIKSLGMDKVKAAGRQALDEGVITPLASTDEMIARNEAVKNRGGEMMGKVYNAIDDAGASKFNPSQVASEFEAAKGNFYRSPINKGETNQFDNTMEAILARKGATGAQPLPVGTAPLLDPSQAMAKNSAIPLSEAAALKNELGKAANWTNKLNVTPKEQMARDAYGLVSRSIDDAAEKGAQSIGQEGLEETLKEGKSLFGKSKDAEKLLENLEAKQSGNKFVSLTDAITGAGALGYGGTTGDWKTAGGIYVGKKGLEKYGAKTAAVGMNALAKRLANVPGALELLQKNPALLNKLLNPGEDGSTVYTDMLKNGK